MLQSMFHLQLPILEKIVRPILVYLVLILFLRLFGKRELAQLNPFDLVVLLSLSNTVQNAIIGDDNSVSGGIIGAFSLLGINWLLMRFLYRRPKLNAALEGTETILIFDGIVDHEAMDRERITRKELLSVLHKNNFDHFEEVQKCVLEPGGTFYLEAFKPTSDDRDRQTLVEAVAKLSSELAALRADLNLRPSSPAAEPSPSSTAPAAP